MSNYPQAAGQPYPAQPYPGQPYPAQPYSDQPPVPARPWAPGQPGVPGPGQPTILACRLCGSVPAVKTTFRGHQGFVIVMRFRHLSGPFCRDCGLGTFRTLTSQTLVQGWYGIYSLFITPIILVVNIVRRGKVAALAAPQPNPYGPSRPPMNPGPRLFERPMTWLGMCIPLVLLTLFVVASSR